MFQKVAVIGAGVMGSGIAAQIANNGIKVYLFDLENPNILIAQQAIEKQLATTPSQFVDPSVASNITPLSLTKDLSKTAECDLIIEAIIENIDLKRKLYNDLANYIKDETLVVSNTSTFRLSELTKDVNNKVTKNFAICHFFNPPRFLRLLEFIPGNLSLAQASVLTSFLTNKLGKEVVICKDTPGFIANRLGTYLMELVLQKTIEQSISVEEVDYIFIKYLSFPSTGIFGLYDLIGLDVMALIAKSLNTSLPKDDEFNSFYKVVPQITQMIEEGLKGRKAKGGFYQLKTLDNGKKQKYAINLSTYDYQEAKKVDLPYKSIVELIDSNSKEGRFINEILKNFFAYTIKISNDIASDIYGIDKAMQLGCAWKYGPYELMQKYNFFPNTYNKSNEIDSTKFGINCKSFSTIKHNLNLKPLLENEVTKLWKVQENKLVLEITSKMSVLSYDVFNAIINSVTTSAETNSDLIIYSDSDHFSAGADLKLFIKYIEEDDRDSAVKFLELGQRAMSSIKHSKMPVISCARGVALGGGCELLLHSDFIVAHQDLSAGLVETSIGLIPGWGGLKEMVLKADSDKDLSSNIGLILSSYKSTSAIDFSIKFRCSNLASLANRNNLLEYALSNKFSKKQNKASVQIGNLELGLNNDIANLIKMNLSGNMNEKTLFESEKAIFSKLLFEGNVLDELKSI